MHVGGGCANGDLTSHQPSGRALTSPPEKCLQKRGSFLFPQVVPFTYSGTSQPQVPIVIAVQNPALPRRTSGMMEMFYILLSSAVATATCDYTALEIWHLI